MEISRQLADMDAYGVQCAHPLGMGYMLGVHKIIIFSNCDYNDRPWRSSNDCYINKTQKYTNSSTKNCSHHVWLGNNHFLNWETITKVNSAGILIKILQGT